MTILECKTPNEILKITASNPLKNCEFFRVVLRPVTIKNELCFQAEKFKGTQVFHENISQDTLSDWLKQYVCACFKQVCVVLKEKDVTYLFSNGKVKRLEKSTRNKKEMPTQSNNRQKNYIFNEGYNIPAFFQKACYVSLTLLQQPLSELFPLDIKNKVDATNH